MIQTKRRRQKQDSIDEYDLGERFKRWARETASKAVTYVFAHPKPVAYSSLATVTLGVTWWMVAHYRPAVPPPPRARPMQMMMQAVEQADQRVRAERSELEQDGQFRGIFETMRDMPIPLSTGTPAGGNQSESQVPEEKQ
jgi:hypothetical protein